MDSAIPLVERNSKNSTSSSSSSELSVSLYSDTVNNNKGNTKRNKKTGIIKKMSTSLQQLGQQEQREEKQERQSGEGATVEQQPQEEEQEEEKPTAAKRSWGDVAARLFLGQVLALSIALTGLFSSLLAQKKASVPFLQSQNAYSLIFLICLPLHISYSSKKEKAKQEQILLEQQRQEEQKQERDGDNDNRELIPEAAASVESSSTAAPCYVFGIPGFFSCRFPLWRYLLLSTGDVSANFFAIWAYSFTDITSAQLLDASTIFTVMILGYVLLARRFNLQHYFGVFFALGGMLGLVFMDADNKSRDSDKTAPNAVLGDIMTLVGSVLYGFTNIANECLLKSDMVTLPEKLRKCVDSCEGRYSSSSSSSSSASSSGADVVIIVSEQRNDQSNSRKKKQKYQSLPSSTSSEQEEEDGKGKEKEKQEQQEQEEEVSSAWGTLSDVYNSFDLIVEIIVCNSFFGLITTTFLLVITTVTAPPVSLLSNTSDNNNTNFNNHSSSSTTTTTTMYNFTSTATTTPPPPPDSPSSSSSILNGVSEARLYWDEDCTIYQIGFCLVMVTIYVGMPCLLKLTNATFVCLSLLTADAYAVVLNYATSGVAPTGWYYLTGIGILLGTLLFDTADSKSLSIAKLCRC